jgi:hypothetical protein
MNPAHFRCLLVAVYLCLNFSAFVASAAETTTTISQMSTPAPAAATPINSGDNAWLLASSALVLMMTAPGLILFYGGLVRTKNVLSTMMHSLILMALISGVWMVFGYSMAFGSGNAFFGNPLTHLFLKGVGAAPDGLCGDNPGADVHAVPDDVRHHHARAHQRRGGGTHQVQRLRHVHAAVGDGGLFSAVPHDVGQGRIF